MGIKIILGYEECPEEYKEAYIEGVRKAQSMYTWKLNSEKGNKTK